MIRYRRESTTSEQIAEWLNTRREISQLKVWSNKRLALIRIPSGRFYFEALNKLRYFKFIQWSSCDKIIQTFSCVLFLNFVQELSNWLTQLIVLSTFCRICLVDSKRDCRTSYWCCEQGWVWRVKCQRWWRKMQRFDTESWQCMCVCVCWVLCHDGVCHANTISEWLSV